MSVKKHRKYRKRKKHSYCDPHARTREVDTAAPNPLNINGIHVYFAILPRAAPYRPVLV